MPNNDVTALVQQPNQTSDLISRLIAQYQSAFQPQVPEHWGIKLLNGGLYLFAMNAGLPYVSPAMQFSSNEALSYFFGASVYLAIGSVSVWSVRNYKTYIKLSSTAPTADKSTELAITMGSAILGIISALPGALVTLKYNPLWMLPLSLFFDVSTNTASLNQFFRRMYIDQHLYRDKKGLFNAREQLIKKLQYGLSDHAITSEPTKQTIIDEFNQALSIAAPKLKKKKNAVLLSDQALYYLTNTLGFLLPLPWEIICIILVSTDLQNMLDLNLFAAGFFAICTTFPAFFLEFLFAVSILNAVYELGYNCAYKIPSTNPAFNSNPVLSMTMLVSGLSLIGGAFTSRAQIISDLLAESAFRDALLYLVCVGTIVFKMSAMSMNLLELENEVAAQMSLNPIYKRKLLFNNVQTILEIERPETVDSLLTCLEHCEESEEDTAMNEEQPRKSNHGLTLFHQKTSPKTSPSFRKNPITHKNDDYYTPLNC